MYQEAGQEADYNEGTVQNKSNISTHSLIITLSSFCTFYLLASPLWIQLERDISSAEWRVASEKCGAVARAVT